MDCIRYNGGYKYQLKQGYSLAIDILPASPISTAFVELGSDGRLTLRKGYAWDGPSGPTIDTKNFMRGSLVHDALYQLMREQQLDKARYRDQADRLLQRLCREDGMSALRAWWVYQGVKRFGDPAADPSNNHPPILAPKGCTP